ncbi:MAG: Tat pathway signal sequence domain protein [Nonomuraea sp.]|nr:Tat pathway signal sequence domain protein [Nonomuraea sp.]
MLAGSAVLLTGDSAPEAAQRAEATPAPGDPLTQGEIRRAAEIAGRDHLATGRTELLYVERDDDKTAPGRRADAYLYDYATDTLTVRTVDLGRSEVVAQTSGRGAQPPPSPREALRAAELLLADHKLGKGVRQAFAKAAGRPLRSVSELGLRGLVYRSPGGPCRTHRCVRLFVRLPGGRFLDTSRIVIDLSAGTVTTLEW